MIHKNLRIGRFPIPIQGDHSAFNSEPAAAPTNRHCGPPKIHAHPTLGHAKLGGQLADARTKTLSSSCQRFPNTVREHLTTPLRSACRFSELLEEECRHSLDGEPKEYLEAILRGAGRMNQMIDGLLSLSRISTTQDRPTEVYLNVVLEQVLDYLHAEIDKSGADITVQDLPRLIANKSQMVRLFQNLIDNAIKYRSETPPKISIEANEKDDEWVLTVRDNGIGIEPRHQGRVFDVFHRLHSFAEIPGTGIGLAECKKIVEKHGGRIWIESSDSTGSVFQFSLPSLQA